MKAPAYQWYPKDILASQRVAEMSAEEECWYRRALDFCWVNGSLPADPVRFARIVGKGCTEEGATAVQHMFVVDRKDTTRLIHDRQEVERKKQKQNRANKVKAGKASAAKRMKPQELHDQQKGNTCSSSVEVVLPTESNSSSASSSATAVKKEVGARKPPPTSKDVILEFQGDPTYTGINVAREYGKMANWCRVNNKQPSRARFVNWLNRAEVPIGTQDSEPSNVKCPDCHGTGVYKNGSGGMVKCSHSKLNGNGAHV